MRGITPGTAEVPTQRLSQRGALEEHFFTMTADIAEPEALEDVSVLEPLGQRLSLISTLSLEP